MRKQIVVIALWKCTSIYKFSFSNNPVFVTDFVKDRKRNIISLILSKYNHFQEWFFGLDYKQFFDALGVYLPKHCSSDGRAGEARIKGPKFESCFDPLRSASKQKPYLCNQTGVYEWDH